MPYTFRDTNSKAGNYELPSEALKINGAYIEELFVEDLTLGATYQTLNVQGRELSAQEATDIEVGVRHGSFLSSRRFKPRELRITYKLEASSNEYFRQGFNKLNEILNVQDAELIFADEPDKFYIGTVTEVGEIEPGRNAVVGEFTITCFDPFKYSVNEFEVLPSGTDVKAFVCEYDGTYPAYPVFETDFASDCGYVAFMDDSNKVIQIGNPDQKDGIDYPASQCLLNHTFSELNGWTANAGTTCFGGNYAIQVGSFKALAFGRAEVASLGSGDKWHGPSLYRALPADRAGELGADNWRFFSFLLFEENHISNDGHLELALLDVNKNIVAAFYIDNDVGTNYSNVRLYVGSSSQLIRINTAKGNKYFGDRGKPLLIQKSGNRIMFKFGDLTYSFSKSNLPKVRGVSIYAAIYGSYSILRMCPHGIYNAQFVKDNCTTWKDIPNLFSAGDKLVADSSEAKITLNELPRPELGALGNQWESFALQPGSNQVGIAWSPWATEPTFRMKYRKVYI